MQGLSRLRSAIPGRAMISSASLLSSITDGIIRTGLLLPPHHRCPGEAASNMPGHSKWSTIKRKKAANDAKRGNIFTRLAREIALAAREGGGDPESNFALRLAGEGARAAHMPKENIERAVRRGTGEDKDAAAFERIVYEGYAPHGVAIIMEVVTDNRNRTVAELRHPLSKAGGSLAEAGAVAWQFRRAAYFSIPARGVDRERLFEMAVEAGADGGV